MNPTDLNAIVAGFDHQALGSQAVFRTALQALSNPGKPLAMPGNASFPQRGHQAAAALLLALLDADTALWVSPSLENSDAVSWLRFHTGCQLAAQASLADFCWFGVADSCQTLHALAQGTDNFPDQSATCVLEVTALHADLPGWTLKGPGILNQRQLRVLGPQAQNQWENDLLVFWQNNHASFPRGVDIFLASATHIAGLPRTTDLQLSAKD
jgi:alpha-D-ribose 1-methylphosphonate 5-triphosphate synthase subunit PhnH